jgi:hypothetical protein
MTWSEFSRNWHAALIRLQARFPLLNGETLPRPSDDLEDITRRLADIHDLTPREASEELADLIFVESLARQASEMARTPEQISQQGRHPKDRGVVL